MSGSNFANSHLFPSPCVSANGTSSRLLCLNQHAKRKYTEIEAKEPLLEGRTPQPASMGPTGPTGLKFSPAIAFGRPRGCGQVGPRGCHGPHGPHGPRGHGRGLDPRGGPGLDSTRGPADPRHATAQRSPRAPPQDTQVPSLGWYLSNSDPTIRPSDHPTIRLRLIRLSGNCKDSWQSASAGIAVDCSSPSLARSAASEWPKSGTGNCGFWGES